MQAQKIAGHAHVDMTGAYTLNDRERQGHAVREHQERILGVVPIRQKAVANEPKQAKKAGNAKELECLLVLCFEWWARQNSNL
jgi:hypothetical protein